MVLTEMEHARFTVVIGVLIWSVEKIWGRSASARTPPGCQKMLTRALTTAPVKKLTTPKLWIIVRTLTTQR